MGFTDMGGWLKGEGKVKYRVVGIILSVFAFTSFMFIVSAYAGSTSITNDGIKFPDGTTQTTAAGSGSTPWISYGNNIYYNNGNVGVGASNPTEKFEVMGNIKVSGDANGIKFSDGSVQKSASVPAWSQILPDNERFTLVMDSDEGVLDNETGLVWERSPSTTTMVWKYAPGHCYTKEVGGRKGWRLPTIDELASLGYPGFPEGHPFVNVNDNYWSSSSWVVNSGSYWYFYFPTLIPSYYFETQSLYVWCVRGK